MSKKRFAIIEAIVVLVVVAGVFWCYEIYTYQHSKPSSAQVAGEIWQPFSIVDHPGFQDATTSLEEMVQSENDSGTNNFCIVGYKDSVNENNDYAWVYWKEKDELILWNGSVDPAQYNALIFSRRTLHLNTDDVVLTREKVPFGSTYVTTQAWVNQIMDNCWKFGNLFSIQ